MEDLSKCSFEELGIAAGLSVTAVSRIRAVYRAYQRRSSASSSVCPPASRTSASLAASDGDCAAVKAYFQANAHKLIRVSEVVRATGLKKSAVLAILNDAPWCQPVDGSTFFFRQ